MAERLRHTARVTVAPCDVRGRVRGTAVVAPCDVRGRVRGTAVEATAAFIDPADRPRALAALRRTYGRRFRLGYLPSRAWARLTRPGTERHELLRISPS